MSVSVRKLAAVAAAVLLGASPTLANPILRAALHPSFKGTVGLCLLLNPEGSVLDTKVVEPSGNPNLDSSVGAWARSLAFRPTTTHHAPHWFAMYASFEGATEKAGQPDCHTAGDTPPR